MFVTQNMTVTPWLMSPMAEYRLQIKNFFFRLNVSFHMQYTQAIHITLVAQLVACRTHDRKVVGSIPTNAVCFTVVR